MGNKIQEKEGFEKQTYKQKTIEMLGKVHKTKMNLLD